MGLNLFVGIGNLVTDPELKGVNGSYVCNFRMVVKSRIKRRNNSADDQGYFDETCYIPCEAWDKGAELIAKHFRKGDTIVISEGRIRGGSYEDKNGIKRSTWCVRVGKFEFPNQRINTSDETNDAVVTVNTDEQIEEPAF